MMNYTIACGETSSINSPQIQCSESQWEATILRDKNSKDLRRIVGTAEQVMQMFETALEILQAAQSAIPAPTLEEVAKMRSGERPLTQEAYLLGIFQRVILTAENMASDLQAIDLETLRTVHDICLSEMELNAVEQAVIERTQKGRGKRVEAERKRKREREGGKEK